MMHFFLMTLSLISSFIFFKMNHPLAMGLTLLIQTILISLLTGMITKTFWFSYILFLIFLGGMLVLFIYVTSLASNEKFSFSTNMLINNMLIFMFLISLFYIFHKFLPTNIFSNLEMHETNNLNSFSQENSLFLYKLYNYPINLITILLMIYLLITLIAIVKITKLFYGPIRSMS